MYNYYIKLYDKNSIFPWQQLRENRSIYLIISLFIVNLIDFFNVHIAFHVLCTGNAIKSFKFSLFIDFVF